MTQEDKELLLKDLCARLPHGVKVLDNSHKNYGPSKLINIGIDGSMLVDNEINDIQYYPIIDETKPYLRPMSSMTEEEREDYNIFISEVSIDNRYPPFSSKYVNNILVDEYIDWLNAHHFDYRGLIEKDLALEAPDDMYGKEEQQ